MGLCSAGVLCVSVNKFLPKHEIQTVEVQAIISGLMEKSGGQLASGVPSHHCGAACRAALVWVTLKLE